MYGLLMIMTAFAPGSPAPVIVDLDIQPDEIAVFHDEEKWCFTIVAVVSFIEIHERWSDGQTSMELFGDIKPQEDLHTLMQKMVVNSSDVTESSSDRLTAMSQRGWLSSEFKALNENRSSWLELVHIAYECPFVIITFIFVLLLTSAMIGFSIGVRYEYSGRNQMDFALKETKTQAAHTYAKASPIKQEYNLTYPGSQ